jgi:glycosyltransferase involved in cell wall biosynthesis
MREARGQNGDHAAAGGRGEPHARRRRVMLFTDSFIHGGTERQFVAALRMLDRQRFDIRVGCLKRRGPFLPEVEGLGLPIHEFPTTSLYGRGTLGLLRRLMRLLREEQIELVHSFDFYTNVFAGTAAWLAGVPAILISRREMAGDRSVFQQAAIRFSAFLADGIVANSRAAGMRLTGRAPSVPGRLGVVPNCIDPAPFHPDADPRQAAAALGLAPASVHIGLLAALRPEKDIATFLRAAALAARELESAQFVLIGEGSERDRLKGLAAELGIAERVVFLGDRSDIPEVLAAMDVVALSSITESFPNAVLEAMAAGRAVVATRVGGVPELVRDGETGWLVPPRDAQAMARRIIELAGSPSQRQAMGQAGRALAVREFSPWRMKERLEGYYEETLRRRAPLGRILQIGNFPPPVCGWSLHTKLVHEDLLRRGADSRVLDIGPGRHVEGRGCIPLNGGFDYAWKVLAHRFRGFTFHAHLNGDSWKGYLLTLAPVLLGGATGKPAVITFHAGPSQIFFPRQRGFWRLAFRLLFAASGEIICNHEPVKAVIESYGVPAVKVHAIPAYSVEYAEQVPASLPDPIDEFLCAHEPRLFSYSLFRPEFTIDALWEAFGTLRQRFPRAGLVLAGPQAVPQEVQQSLQQKHLESSVLIPGNLPHAQFLTAVQRSDVFVRTHLRDGVCTSVLEALSLGVPVVAAEDGQRPPSVVTYAPGDGRDLAVKLETVLADLPSARERVLRPGADNNLEREVALLLRTAGGGRS